MAPAFVARIVKSARATFHEGGVRGALHMLRFMLFSRVEMSVWAADLTPDYTPPACDPRIALRRGRPEDLVELRAHPEGGRVEFYRDQIDGAEPWVAAWQGTVAHIGWIYTAERPSRFVRLGPDEAELRYGYTLEGYRGFGLYAALNGAMTADLARRGFKRVYGVAADYGRAYRLGLEFSLRRIGWTPRYTFVQQRVLGVQVRPRLSL